MKVNQYTWSPVTDFLYNYVQNSVWFKNFFSTGIFFYLFYSIWEEKTYPHKISSS